MRNNKYKKQRKRDIQEVEIFESDDDGSQVQFVDRREVMAALKQI